MTPDSELLLQFLKTNSQDAFGELVKRHVNLVYSAALRQVNGDEHLAKDVAQTVFMDLARKAGSLSNRENLSGWLYTSAHFAAAKMVRTENRRRDREEKFMREPINESSAGVSPANAPGADWEKIRPALDDAMHELKESDREAILFRYFENKPFVQIGAKLGLNENAARMRVERALEKLRVILTKRGITTTAALASAISANAIQLAPVNLASTLTTVSIAAAGTGTFTLLKIMTATKLKLALSTIVATGVATAFVVQQQTQNKLRTENELLQQQIMQLQTGNSSLSNRLVGISDAKRLSDDQFNELLKLRGEVGVLRNQAIDLNQDNATLKRQLADFSKSKTNLTSVPQLHIKSRFISVSKEGFSTPDAAVNGLTGILSNQNFTNVLAMLEKREGVENLGEPEATATSGRQIEMQATKIISVITNFALVESDGTNVIVPQSAQIKTGPIIDVSPKILSDGRTIELPVTASILDFLGYEKSANRTIPVYTRSGEEVDVPQVLPQFRNQESTAKVNVLDGQTLVLKLNDKQVPSDTFLQSSNDPNVKKPLAETLVFITVTIVDSAGQKKYQQDLSDSMADQSIPVSGKSPFGL